MKYGHQGNTSTCISNLTRVSANSVNQTKIQSFFSFFHFSYFLLSLKSLSIYWFSTKHATNLCIGEEILLFSRLLLYTLVSPFTLSGS